MQLGWKFVIGCLPLFCDKYTPCGCLTAICDHWATLTDTPEFCRPIISCRLPILCCRKDVESYIWATNIYSSSSLLTYSMYYEPHSNNQKRLHLFGQPEWVKDPEVALNCWLKKKRHCTNGNYPTQMFKLNENTSTQFNVEVWMDMSHHVEIMFTFTNFFTASVDNLPYSRQTGPWVSVFEILRHAAVKQ